MVYRNTMNDLSSLLVLHLQYCALDLMMHVMLNNL